LKLRTFVTAFAALGACAACAAAIVYDQDVSSGLDGLHQSVILASENVGSFCGGALVSLNALAAVIPTTVDAVDGAFSNGTELISNVTDIVEGIDALAGQLQDVAFPTGCEPDSPPCYICAEPCSASASKAMNASIFFREALLPAVDSLNNSRHDLYAALNSAKANVENRLVEVREKIGILHESTLEFSNETNIVYDKISTVNFFRKLVVVIVFAFGAMISLGSMLLIFLESTPSSPRYTPHLRRFLITGGFIVGLLTAIVLCVCLPLVIVFGDTCVMADMVTGNFSLYFTSPVSIGVDACFSNTSLLKAFGELDLDLLEGLNFTRLAELPVAPDFDNEQDAFFTLALEVDGITSRAFGVNASDLKPLISELNSLTNCSNHVCQYKDSNYTTENVLTPWVADGARAPSPVLPDSALNFMRER